MQQWKVVVHGTKKSKAQRIGGLRTAPAGQHCHSRGLAINLQCRKNLGQSRTRTPPHGHMVALSRRCRQAWGHQGEHVDCAVL